MQMNVVSGINTQSAARSFAWNDALIENF